MFCGGIVGAGHRQEAFRITEWRRSGAIVPAPPTGGDQQFEPGALARCSGLRDGDAGDVGDSKSGFVTVLVGDLSEGSPVRIIMFDVIIN